MNFEEVRRLTITALFSDDVLFEQLVLKGGNAISLVHRLGARASLDVDFSLAADFPDFEDAKRRAFRALENRFESAGFVLFDEKLEVKPRLTGPDERPWWGGYELSFKLIGRENYTRLTSNPRKRQIAAIAVSPNGQPTVKVDISKYEYTEGYVERELDHFIVRVYTPAMLAIEKLRAICQQMPEYTLRSAGRPRARDFYDIWLTVTEAGVDLTSDENRDVIQQVFAAKQVPLPLLDLVARERDFHRPDWPAVVAAVGRDLQEFDFYFDFVLGEIDRLKALWNR